MSLSAVRTDCMTMTPNQETPMRTLGVRVLRLAWLRYWLRVAAFPSRNTAIDRVLGLWLSPFIHFHLVRMHCYFDRALPTKPTNIETPVNPVLISYPSRFQNECCRIPF